MELERLVRNAQIDYECIDDPEELILVMCGEQYGARECQAARQTLRTQWDWKVHGKSIGSLLSYSKLLLIHLLFFSVRFS